MHENQEKKPTSDMVKAIKVVLVPLLVLFDYWWIVKFKTQLDVFVVPYKKEAILDCFLTGFLCYGIIHTILVQGIFYKREAITKNRYAWYLFSLYIWVGSSLTVAAGIQPQIFLQGIVYLLTGVVLIAGAMFFVFKRHSMNSVGLIVSGVAICFFTLEMIHYAAFVQWWSGLILLPFILLFGYGFLYLLRRRSQQ
jgi:hypothetical protein